MKRKLILIQPLGLNRLDPDDGKARDMGASGGLSAAAVAVVVEAIG